MPETKNICGKIPVDLHEKVRQEIEQTESSTQKFIQQVIEEHFMRKGESSMAARTIAVQVTEELFGRLKEVVLRKGCKQKDFLIGIIEQAIAAEEAKWKEAEADMEEPDAEGLEEPNDTDTDDEVDTEDMAEDGHEEEQQSAAEAEQPEDAAESEEEE